MLYENISASGWRPRGDIIYSTRARVQYKIPPAPRKAAVISICMLHVLKLKIINVVNKVGTKTLRLSRE